MTKLDISSWGSFQVEDLFEVVRKTEKEKGHLTGPEKTDDYSMAGITGSTINNGIGCYVIPKQHKPVSDILTLAPHSGKVFYQPYKIALSRNVYGLKFKAGKINPFAQRFVAAIMNQFNDEKFNYKNLASWNRYKKETIPLPQTPEGTPDWAYMEAYMEQIRKRVDDTVATLEKVESPNKPIDTSQWGDFKIEGLFEIVGSKTTPKYQLDLLDKPNNKSKYPYITTSATNNGVAGYSDKWTEKGNVLTVDSAVIGYVTYQSQNFTASDHVEVLKPKFPMNEYIGLYIAAIMNQKGKQIGYQYNHKRSQKALRSESIPLPQTPEGAPDWAYMEAYMDNVRKRIDQKVAALEGLK